MTDHLPNIPNKDECVKVVVRCRPMNAVETERGCEDAVEVYEDAGRIELYKRGVPNRQKEPPKLYTFDAVFGRESTQQQVYQETAAPVVDSVLEGYNGTIFAYGQTGSGKTFTMEGYGDSEESLGIIPRALRQIFEDIGSAKDKQFLLSASMLEIYNEEIRDLISKKPQTAALKLGEDVNKGVYVKNLTSYVVKQLEELDHVLALGKRNRTTATTAMNDRSSRSHSIFTIVVESSEKGDDGETHIRVGKLNLVDLAGSEKSKKTQATGKLLMEGCKINLSLHALGNVISALVDPKQTHIPYRHSKLTRLLQDSLGGNTKTVMIANIGPADYNQDETLSTLRYANRAKNIRNKPVVNEDPKDAMLRELGEEILRLKAELESRKAGPVPAASSVDGLDPEFISQLQVRSAEEMENLMKEKGIIEEERERIAKELLENEARLQKEREEKEELERKLMAVQQSVVIGGEDLLERTKAQEAQLRKREHQLRQQREAERILQAQVRIQEDEMVLVQEKFGSLEDELNVKTAKLRKLWQKYQSERQDKADMEQEWQQEKAEMLDTIRELNKHLQLKMLIIDKFIPQDEAVKIETRARWNEDDEYWEVKNIEYAGNNVRQRRPTADFAMRRPMSEYARVASAMGDQNPRYKEDNIVDLEVDMPDRTTRDYDRAHSARWEMEAALQAAFTDDDDDEILFTASESLPNVYISYSPPSTSAPGRSRPSGTLLRSSQTQNRSSPRCPRPSSASRARVISTASDNRSGGRADGEAWESNEQYPSARGLVRTSKRFA